MFRPKLTLTKLIITIVLTLGLSISFQSLLADWAAPTSAPPDDNLGQPIDTSASTQTKDGDLGVLGDLSIDTNTLVVDSDEDQVGIGIDNPGAKLHVVMGSADYGGVIISGQNHSATDSATRLHIQDLTGNVGWMLSAMNDGKFAIHQAGVADRLTINNTNGNVGIGGTSNPETKLMINGNIAYGDSYANVITRHDAGLRGDAGARSGFYQTSVPAPAANWPSGAVGWWHLIDVRHSNPANNYALQIAGSFWGQDLYFRKTSDNPAMPWNRFIYEDSSGNVGIGTVGPLGRLDVVTAQGFGLGAGLEASRAVFRRLGGGNGGVGLGGWNDDGVIQSADWTSGGIASDLLINPSGGNVGIGTDNPGYNLDVTGDINFSGDLYQNEVLFSGGGGASGPPLGNWDSTMSFNTNYLAPTDGIVIAYYYANPSASAGRICGYTDNTTAPTTLITCDSGDNIVGTWPAPYGSFTMPVKQGDYWRVTRTNLLGSSGGNVNWIPLSGAVDTGDGTPAGAIMQFYLSSCPAGWKPADGTNGTPDLRGQFVRGLNSFDNGTTVRSDTNEDPDGLRALGNLQQDELEQHAHSIEKYNVLTTAYGNPAASLWYGAVAGTTGDAGGDETRSRNVALIFCQKE